MEKEIVCSLATFDRANNNIMVVQVLGVDLRNIKRKSKIKAL
jgi:hypothetical protein